MIIERALKYPYDIPAQSYFIHDGVTFPWDENFDLSGRTPVLACGSNQSPSQLARKFPSGFIPVMAGRLKDYDSVYSAHFTAYGSIAATYHYAPGVTSRQMITWLTPDQLEAMHQSEALGINYTFVGMSDIDFTSDCGQNINQAHTYQSIQGPLKINDSPVGLDAIEAANAPYVRLSQEALQTRIVDMLSPQDNLVNFVKQTIENKEKRIDRTNQLLALSQSCARVGP